jgi:hypothetical protein
MFPSNRPSRPSSASEAAYRHRKLGGIGTETVAVLKKITGEDVITLTPN